ncbi:MAG: hypothetical protein K2X50_08525 [Gammaproteobacteria bacterium]|nr:hypothetical protein [Gammaproteobacteria bacterium]
MKTKPILMLIFIYISFVMPSISTQKKDPEISPFVTYITHPDSKLRASVSTKRLKEIDTDAVLNGVDSFPAVPSRGDLPDLHVCSTLLVSCIDFRLRDEVEKFMRETLGLLDGYDEVVLPGAALAVTASTPGHGIVDNSPTAPYYWAQKYYDSLFESVINAIMLAREKHHIERVILLDHSKCAAYTLCKDHFDPANEVNEHKGELAFASKRILEALKDFGHFPEPIKVYSLYCDLNTPGQLTFKNFHQLGVETTSKL